MKRWLRACLLTALAAFAVPRASSEEPSAPPLVAWQELVEHPARYLGKTVTLRGQFQERVAGWNPYLTRFGTREFGAFQLWSDEQFPWIESEFRLPRMRLFARRGQPAECLLGTAPVYVRLELVATVRELFLDLPWVEVEHVSRLEQELSEGTNIHAARGIELVEKQSFALAAEEFEQALSGNLPAHARAELERLRDEAKAEAQAARTKPRR